MIRPALPGTDTDRTCDLDGLGNWQESVFTPVGDSETTDQRTHNYLNQVTEFDAGTDVLYDHGDNADSGDPDVQRRGNGNVAADGTREYVYDAFNRLKTVERKSDGETVATYTYDALGRRIRKVVSGGGLPGDLDNVTTDYLYSGVQCVEEHNPFGGEEEDVDTPVRQYVWGLYVDELIQQKEKGDPDTYLLSDLLYRSVALTDDDKDIQEAYDTDAYGNTLTFSGPGTDAIWFTNDDLNIDDDATRAWPLCRFGFTGRSHDYETGIYFYRARYYHQELGRFVSRDPVGYQQGMDLYEYSSSSPASSGDPHGLTVIGLWGFESPTWPPEWSGKDQVITMVASIYAKLVTAGVNPGPRFVGSGTYYGHGRILQELGNWRDRIAGKTSCLETFVVFGFSDGATTLWWAVNQDREGGYSSAVFDRKLGRHRNPAFVGFIDLVREWFVPVPGLSLIGAPPTQEPDKRASKGINSILAAQDTVVANWRSAKEPVPWWERLPRITDPRTYRGRIIDGAHDIWFPFEDHTTILSEASSDVVRAAVKAAQEVKP